MPHQRAISLCQACEADLPLIQAACHQCGLPMNTKQLKCGQCSKASPTVDYTLSLFHYETPVDYMIGQLKFNHKLMYASILGDLLQKHINQHLDTVLPEVLIPVPLHKERLISRGFNQSLEIARVVSKSLSIPVNTSLVKRIKNTQAQMELDARTRQKNIRNCFEIDTNKTSNENTMLRHVVIIDDVVTTGSTVNELAKLLKKNGVEKVGVWSVARAVLR